MNKPIVPFYIKLYLIEGTIIENMKLKILQIGFLIFITTVSYGQWQQCSGTEALNMQSLLTKGNYNFAGGQTGAYLSTNGGASYSLSNSGNDAVGPTRGFASDNNYIYTCTSQGVFRSANNGATWISKNTGLTNLLTSGIIKVGSYLFVVGPTGVSKSNNQGESWSTAGLSATDVRCIAAIQDTLFVGTNGLGIYKSIDFGINWIPINNGLTSTNFRAIESKGNILFSGGQIGTGVFRSTDFGASWTLLSGGLSSGSYRGFASNGQLIIAGSFGGGVFYSTDNGNNWTAINTGLTDLTIFDLELNSTHIIAATNTQGVFRFPLSSLNLSTGIQKSLNENDFAFYPNPFNNSVTVEINLISDKQVSLLIYNSIGQLIETTLNNLELPAGTYKHKLDFSSLPSGFYTAVLKTNKEVVTKKMMYLK